MRVVKCNEVFFSQLALPGEAQWSFIFFLNIWLKRMKRAPEELWWSVLACLGPETLLAARAVDRATRALVDDPVFARGYYWRGEPVVSGKTTVQLLLVACVHCGKFQGTPTLGMCGGRVVCFGCISRRWYAVPEPVDSLTVWAGGVWRHPTPREEAEQHHVVVDHRPDEAGVQRSGPAKTDRPNVAGLPQAREQHRRGVQGEAGHAERVVGAHESQRKVRVDGEGPAAHAPEHADAAPEACGVLVVDGDGRERGHEHDARVVRQRGARELVPHARETRDVVGRVHGAEEAKRGGVPPPEQ